MIHMPYSRDPSPDDTTTSVTELANLSVGQSYLRSWSSHGICISAARLRQPLPRRSGTRTLAHNLEKVFSLDILPPSLSADIGLVGLAHKLVSEDVPEGLAVGYVGRV